MKSKIEAVTYFPKRKRINALETLSKAKHIRLWGETSFLEINSICLRLYGTPSNHHKNITVENILKTIIRGDLDDFANLNFISESYSLYSGCCFDFFDWQELKGIKKDKYDIWLGHSPMTSIFIDSKKDKVFLWDAETVELKEALGKKEFVEYTFREFKDAVQLLLKDLTDFGKQLENWSKQFNNEISEKFVQKIKKYLAIE